MGIYLSTPKTDKTSDDGENEHCRYGVSAMQGWRSTMEDAHAAVLDLDKDMSFFGVYDGHGGKVVSRFCAKYLHYQVLKNKSYTKGDLSQSLQKAYLRMDDMMRGQRGWRELSVMNGEKNTKLNSLWEALSPSSSHKNLERKSSGAGIIEEDDGDWNSETGSHADFQGPTSGCTAVVALLQKDRVVVANAGDSRCVLSRRGKAFDLSRDHKPYLEQEKDRILQAGGFILAGRINGSLNLTRAIGDMEFKQNKYLPPEKQIVTAWPDTISVELTPADEFLILACDGIWDVLSSQEAVDFVHENMKGATRVSSICEKLLERCLAPNTALGEGCDNMTVIIVMLNAALPLSQ